MFRNRRILTHVVRGAFYAAVLTASISPVAPLFTPAAVAQSATLQSDMTGITLPKGATRITDRKLVNGFGRFLGESGAKTFGLPEKSAPAEVYVWTGANFRPGRLGFSRTAVQAALTEAGFTTYKEIPDYENYPNHFEVEWDLEGMNFGPVDGRPSYFVATNDKRKMTVVGFWIEQKLEKRLVFAIAQAGYQATEVPVENTLPAITDPNTILVEDNNNAAASLPAPRMPAFAKMTPKPRTARGVVKDGSGQPVANACVVVQASAAGGLRTNVTGYTNANGVYEIPLPIGVCQVIQADAPTRQGGKTYQLPLQPADGRFDTFNADKGHVENLVLFGGGGNTAVIRINNNSGVNGGIVEVTLVPEGPLLDGSKGYTLVFRFPNRNIGEYFLGGIPIGKYTMKVKLYEGGEALPMRSKLTFTDGAPEVPPTTNFPVVFKGRSRGTVTMSGSPVERFEVTILP